MARCPRIDVPGVPQHVVQRGVNRSVCFVDDLDREFYLACLREMLPAHHCRLHAYVLMTNHVHLLVTGEETGAISSLMQSLGRTYVRRFNNRYQRTGTLWEGRFKSNIVDSDRYVITCYRYIELNPVRARMTQRPEDHAWSSVHHNAFGSTDPLIDPHPGYLGLNTLPVQRLADYRALLDQALSEEDVMSVRSHLQQGKVYGSSSFQAQIQEITNRAVQVRPRGRPRKVQPSEK